MKTSSSNKDSQELAGLVQNARRRVAAAEMRRKAAKEQARVAKRRCKMVKLIARRARKQAKQAKADLAEAREALAKAEAKLARSGARRSTKSPAKVKARPVAKVTATGKKKAATPRDRRTLAAAPLPSQQINSVPELHRPAPAPMPKPSQRGDQLMQALPEPPEAQTGQ